VFGLRLSPLLAVLHLLDLCLHGQPPCESRDIVNVGIPLWHRDQGRRTSGRGDLRPCMSTSAVPRQAQVITPAGGRERPRQPSCCRPAAGRLDLTVCRLALGPGSCDPGAGGAGRRQRGVLLLDVRQYDGLVIFELSDAQTAAALSRAVTGSGAFSRFGTHELIEASDLAQDRGAGEADRLPAARHLTSSAPPCPLAPGHRLRLAAPAWPPPTNGHRRSAVFASAPNAAFGRRADGQSGDQATARNGGYTRPGPTSDDYRASPGSGLHTPPCRFGAVDDQLRCPGGGTQIT